MADARKIETLTDAQKARFPEFVRKWIDIGLCTEPADRQRAEAAIAGLYGLAKLKQPRVIWLPCPISAALSAVCYAAVINHRLVKSEKNAVYSAVGRSVRSAVYSAVGRSVGNAVDSAVGRAVDSAVGRAVGNAVDSAVDSAVGRAVDSAVGRAVGSAVGRAVGSAVYSAVGRSVGNAVDSAVGRAVGSAVGRAVGSAVYSAVGRSVGNAVDSAVGRAVDSAVGRAVGNAVDSAVDSAVGRAVDSAVGRAVGSAVYSAVGRSVGNAVDSAVDSAVGRAVGSVGYSYFGGSTWNAGYSAWADYFNEVCGVAIDRNYLEMTASCGFYWTLDDIVFASERPSEIYLDQDGRLHCETGKAIKYGGPGWGLSYWHGVKVPDHWIEQRDTLDPNEVIKAANVEERAAGSAIVGWPKMLSVLKAKVVNDSGSPDIGQLIELKLPGLREPGRFLKAHCPRNGIIVEGVPRVSDIDGLPIETAISAQAWRIGDPQSEYAHPPLRT